MDAPSPVVDAWVNVFPEQFARAWTAQPENRDVADLFGEDLRSGRTADQLLEAMDGAGVRWGVLTSGLRTPERAHRRGLYAAEDFLELAAAHPGRFAVSVTVDQAERPTANVRRLRELAASEHVVLARVTPLLEQYDLNHRLYYPVYAACEELGLPVSINVGVPGPKVRSACQHPQLLEDVLIDFPDLTVVGAHMGHPYEALLVQYLLKFERLFLMTSAYLATYMDEGLVRFMGSSRGRGRVWFASDHPVLPVGKALDAARRLPLEDEAMAEFLGASAARVLGLRVGGEVVRDERRSPARG